MSKPTILELTSNSPTQTEDLAAKLGSSLRGGEVIAMASDLGGGKTTFVRGLVRGWGSPDHVASPTFTINKTYQSNQAIMHHFDFYRLSEPELMAHELAEAIENHQDIVVIEWADVVRQVLPPEHLTVSLERVNDTSRTIKLSAPSGLAYLLEGLK